MDNGTFFSVFLGWFIFSGVAGTIASRKGRSGPLYFFLGLLASPLVGIAVALAIAPDPEELERRALRSHRSKKCPFCAELIKAEAQTCRYCGRDISGASPAPQPTTATAPVCQAAVPEAIFACKDDGVQHGPFTADNIRAMNAAGAGWTYIWYDGLADWSPISAVSFLSLITSASPVIAKGSSQRVDKPARQRRSTVPNAAVWCAALSPVAMLFVGVVMGTASPAASYLLVAALLCVPVAVDITLLRKHGHTDESYWWLFGILLLAVVFVPVYLRQRAQAVGDGPAYFITSLVCFIGLVLLQIAAAFAQT